jgi:hypothetical protein
MSRTTPLTERGRPDLGVVEAHSDTLRPLLLMAQLVEQSVIRRTVHGEDQEGSRPGRKARKGGRCASKAPRWTTGDPVGQEDCQKGREDRRASAGKSSCSGYEGRRKDHRTHPEAEEGQGRGDCCRRRRCGSSRRPRRGQPPQAVERTPRCSGAAPGSAAGLPAKTRLRERLAHTEGRGGFAANPERPKPRDMNSADSSARIQT